MASSHSSLPSSLGNEEPPVDVAADQPFVEEGQEILHLVPCSWREFLELEPPASGLYEYVDGFVIWCPNMADSEHVKLANSHARLLSCSQRVTIVHTPSVELVNERNQHQFTVDHDEGSGRHEAGPSSRGGNRGSSSRDRGGSSSSRDRNRGSSSRDRGGSSSSRDRNRGSSSRDRNRGSSSRDPVSIQSDMRHPDFSIERRRENSSDSSRTEREPLAKKRIVYSRPLTQRLLAVVEITSHSTRNTDLVAKWKAYARTQIPMYIIIDRGTEREGTERVIVGTLSQLGANDRQSVSGDKQESPATRPATRSQRTATENPPRYYYRRVYRSNEIVNCPYYSELGLTTAKLLNRRFMDNLATRKEDEKTRRAERTIEVEQQLDESERKADELRGKLDESKREADESKREKDEAERKADELRGKLDESNRKLEHYKQQAAKSNQGKHSKGDSPKHKKSRKQ